MDLLSGRVIRPGIVAVLVCAILSSLPPTRALAIQPSQRTVAVAATPHADDTGEPPHSEPLESGPLGSAYPAMQIAAAEADATEGQLFLAQATTVDLSFAGVRGAAQPSDGTLAVGPDHVLQIVNGAPGQSNVAVFSKLGRGLGAQPLSALLGIDPNIYLSDPRAYYDATSARWFIVTFSLDPAAPAARLYLAISRTADPTSGFCYYSKDASLRGGVTGQALPDFPGMAMDEYGLYVTYVRFPYFDLRHPFETRIEMFPRPSLVCGSVSLDPFVWSVARTAPDGRSVWVVQPTTALGPTGVAYFVGTSNGGGYIGVWNVTHSTSPVLNASYLPVATYLPPPAAPQPGTSVPLTMNDNRPPASAIYRQGSLWLSFPALATQSAHSAVRWYEIAVPALTIRQQGELWTPVADWGYPAMMVDRAGAMFLSATFVGPTFGPRQAVLSRSPADPPGELGAASLLQFQTVAYTALVPGETAARWGDYFGIALDPDGIHVWLEGSYSSDGATWSTTIASTHSAGPAASSYRVTVADASPLAGTAVSISAQALDAQGQPLRVAGQVVTWRSSPVGRFSTATSTTDSAGVASVQFTTDANAAQAYVVTATDNAGASGVSPSFTTRLRPAPTAVVYLPNVTKTLGGALGWNTPFYVQNTGVAATDLEIAFYRFADGALIAQRSVRALAPGASFGDSPNLDVDLPPDTQFAVVIKSFGASINAVVTQIQGNGTTTEALLYSGVTTGSNKVYLPNVTRRFFGYDVPLIIQNLGTVATNATARFVSFDGSQTFVVVVRPEPGRSAVIDPDYTEGLIDGTQYAVTVTADQPVAVVANAHNEQGAPVAFSHIGLASGSTTLLAPFAVKGGPDGQFSPIVVQNVGASPSDVTLSFTPIGPIGPTQTFTLRSVAPGASRDFDPRFAFGTKVPCVAASATCLGAGEYSLKIVGTAPMAALILPVSNVTADAYVAPLTPTTRQHLPHVARASGALPAWSSRIAIDAVAAGTASLRWYRVNDGVLLATTTATLAPGTTVWLDARTIAGLPDGQFSVVIDATTQVTTIVQHSYPGGDGSMFYAGFGSTP